MNIFAGLAKFFKEPPAIEQIQDKEKEVINLQKK